MTGRRWIFGHLGGISFPRGLNMPIVPDLKRPCGEIG
jgi:hypothetical protein